MTRWSLLFSGMLLLVSLAIPVNTLAAGSLQKQIDAIPSGGTLVLDAGVYKESLILTKPMTIEGSAGTIISSCTEEDPVITINGEKVTIKNLQVESCSEAEGAAAIVVKGKEHTLENLSITAVQFGIKLDEAMATTISQVEINGQGNKNGIDLWKASDNLY
ncbi:hypothetical protein R4Z09_04620 [Niallia oryzisoli]|uniref:Uncharacterized protein n=1 Tax=Niallia oryzisoli TaxID=1737571 RepID=A0ABZ2CEZ4_9BACI